MLMNSGTDVNLKNKNCVFSEKIISIVQKLTYQFQERLF